MSPWTLLVTPILPADLFRYGRHTLKLIYTAYLEDRNPRHHVYGHYPLGSAIIGLLEGIALADACVQHHDIQCLSFF